MFGTAYTLPVPRISRIVVSHSMVFGSGLWHAKRSKIVQSGERRNIAGQSVRNTILLLTSDSDYSLLRPHLEYVNLQNHLILHEAGKLKFVYFPNRGLISLVVIMKSGKTVEAGIVGNEGFTGIPAAVGLSRTTLQGGGANHGGTGFG